MVKDSIGNPSARPRDTFSSAFLSPPPSVAGCLVVSSVIGMGLMLFGFRIAEILSVTPRGVLWISLSHVVLWGRSSYRELDWEER